MNSNPPISINSQHLIKIISDAALGNGLVPKKHWPALKQERGDKKLIVVAAAPKTGSTFLANTLSKITGLRYFRLCGGYSTNEHDLYLPALCMMNRHGCVSQMHMKGTFHNVAHLKTFGISPIILVRSIEDIVVSLSKELKEKEQLPGYGIGQNGYSFIWQDSCTSTFSEEKLLDLVIDLAIPWYVNFYVSWYRLCNQGNVNALWISYEELMSDKQDTLRKILEFLGYSTADKIDESILSKL